MTVGQDADTVSLDRAARGALLALRAAARDFAGERDPIIAGRLIRRLARESEQLGMSLGKLHGRLLALGSHAPRSVSVSPRNAVNIFAVAAALAQARLIADGLAQLCEGCGGFIELPRD